MTKRCKKKAAKSMECVNFQEHHSSKPLTILTLLIAKKFAEGKTQKVKFMVRMVVLLCKDVMDLVL